MKPFLVVVRKILFPVGDLPGFNGVRDVVLRYRSRHVVAYLVREFIVRNVEFRKNDTNTDVIVVVSVLDIAIDCVLTVVGLCSVIESG